MNKNRLFEFIGIGTLLVLFFIMLGPVLFWPTRMFSHDVLWNYGLAHTFFNSIARGIFPYWDPYGYCGQPLYYCLGLLRVYEPQTIILVLMARIANISLLSAYHWDYVLRILIFAAGAHMCFRGRINYPPARIILFAVILFSSITYSSLRQNGLLLTVCWLPWIMYCLIGIIEKQAPRHWIGFGFFLGLTFSNYQILYTFVFVTVFVLTLLINHRRELTRIITSKNHLGCMFIGSMVFLMLSSPLFAVIAEKQHTVPIHRLISKNPQQIGILIERKYDIYQVYVPGQYTRAVDFLGLALPTVAAEAFFRKDFRNAGIKFSEIGLHIGLVPLALALLGLVRGRDHLRLNFALTLLVVIQFMFGEQNPLVHSLYVVFAPLRMLRHGQLFGGLFIFILFYFLAIGLNRLFESLQKNKDSVGND